MCVILERLDTIETQILFQLTHRFNAVLIKTTETFVDINKLFPKSIWKSRVKEKPRQALKISDRVRLHVFIGYYASVTTSIPWCWWSDRNIDKFNRRFKILPLWGILSFLVFFISFLCASMSYCIFRDIVSKSLPKFQLSVHTSNIHKVPSSPINYSFYFLFFCPGFASLIRGSPSDNMFSAHTLFLSLSNNFSYLGPFVHLEEWFTHPYKASLELHRLHRWLISTLSH